MHTGEHLPFQEAARGQRLHGKIVTNVDEFRALRSTWEEVYSTCPQANPFLSWQWQFNWWLCFAEGRELALIVLHQGRRPIAVAPLYIQRTRFHRISLRCVRFIASEQVTSDHLDFLIAPGFEGVAVGELVKQLRRHFRWDLLAASDIPERSSTHTLVPGVAESLGLATTRDDRVPCPSLELPGCWSEYLAGLTYAARKEIRRKVKRFNRQFASELLDVHDHQRLDFAIAQLARLNRLRRALAGEPGAFTDDDFSAFHRQAIPELVRAGRARILLLLADGAPVAAQYLLCDRDRWHSYQGGFEPQLARYAPGAVLDAMAIRYAIEQHNVRVFDFLRGIEPYKLRLGATPRINQRLLLFNTTGRALGALVAQRCAEGLRNARGPAESTAHGTDKRSKSR